MPSDMLMAIQSGPYPSQKSSHSGNYFTLSYVPCPSLEAGLKKVVEVTEFNNSSDDGATSRSTVALYFGASLF